MTPDATPHAPQDPFDLPRITPAQQARADALYAALLAAYPDAYCELHYTTPHELLIATILSAQTTDVNVNKATPALFKRFPTPADYAAATPDEIEPFVRSLGFFRNKARAIHEAMREVVARHGGQVPRTMEELLALRGVARKTANVVLGNAFNINVGFVVDTHVERLSQRLGLAPPGATVAMTERWLMAQFPRDTWCHLSHMLIFHGRGPCKARMKACSADAICRQFGCNCALPREDSPPSPFKAKRAAKKSDKPPKTVSKKASGKKVGGKTPGGNKTAGKAKPRKLSAPR